MEIDIEASLRWEGMKKSLTINSLSRKMAPRYASDKLLKAQSFPLPLSDYNMQQAWACLRFNQANAGQSAASAARCAF